MGSQIWVECVECNKWRRVPPLSDENAKWRCADNVDARYNSCATPQELSNEDIDAELKAQARPAITRSQRNACRVPPPGCPCLGRDDAASARHAAQRRATHAAARLRRWPPLGACALLARSRRSEPRF